MNKLLLVLKILAARNIVLITDKSYHSSVSRYDDKHFWAYAKKRLKALEQQHYALVKQGE